MLRGQLCYLQIPAEDVEISARFYELIFGWSVEPPGAGFEAPGLIGQWITERSASPEAGPVGWINVPDVAQSLADAVAAGATVREEPTPDGPRMLASFLDPAGNLVGIFQQGDRAAAAERTGRVENRTMPASTVIPELTYEDVTEAIVWLCDKFGFAERWRVGDHRAQLSIGNGTVAITEPRTSKVRPGPRDIMVRVDDVAGHCERARARGATIVSEPRDYPYGERQYTAEDLGGHHWCFSQSIADVAPEEWGGTTGPALEAPSRRPTISVMLIVPDAEAAIAWYYDALGADVLWNLGGVAGLHVAGAPFFLHEVNPRNPTETSPDQAGVTSVRIELFVDDPDAFLDRALAAGATPGSPIVEHQTPWGTHRQGGFRDPFGHNWSVGDRSPLVG